MDFNYENIKDLGKESGVSVKNYLALSPNNDPFYVGSTGQMMKAEWFSKIYALMGSPTNCHIRRVHYWLVSQKPKYRKPDGSDYMNTVKDWGYLTMAAKYARYAKLVPIENMVDRRNPPPTINASSWSDESPSEIRDSMDDDDIIDGIASKFACWNPHNTQKYLLEIYCEKSTMNDVLLPIAKKYGINLVTGLGELSITTAHEFIERAIDIDKPVRIFYISDFDPAGECMPVSISRKIEYFMHQRNLDLDIKLIQTMLTPIQCLSFDLPRTPIKPTERRKDKFEARHGTGATELDALEALYPGEMAKIVEAEIMKYFDIDAWNDVVHKNSEVRDKIKSYLEDKVTNVLEDIDLTEFDDYLPPESELVSDDDLNWIYDSSLNYLDQLDSYNRFRGKK